MMQRLKSNVFLWNSLVLLTGTMAVNVLNYIFHLVAGRMVSVPVYGEIESLLSLINIISVPGMTLTMVAVQYSAKAKAKNSLAYGRAVMKYLNSKIFKYGWPFFAIALIATPLVGDFLKIESSLPIILVWILMFGAFFLSSNIGILQGWQKFESMNKASIWGTAMKLVAGVVFIKAGLALNGAMAGVVFGLIISYAISLFALKFIVISDKKKNGDYSKQLDLSSLKKYVLPVFVGNLAINILGNVDMVLAKHNLDEISAGEYGALTVISKIIFFGTGAIAMVLFSMSAEDNHKKRDTMIIFKKSFILMLITTVFATAFYFMFPSFVISVLFGSKYGNIVHLLGWFGLLASLFSFANLTLQYLLSINRTKIVYSFLAIAVITIFLVLFFGKTVCAILVIMSVAQMVAIIMGLSFLFLNNKKKKYAVQ